MSFQYKARSTQQWEKRSQQSGNQWEGFVTDAYRTYTPKSQNWVRILPPTWENPTHYGMDIWLHYSVGPNNATVLCLNRMLKQKCPICEAQVRAEARGDEQGARELRSTRRVLSWILDRSEEKTPLLWSMPWTVDRDISIVSRDKQTGELYQIDHPDAGFDITFNREGEGMNVKYVGIAVARRSSPVDERHLKYITENPVPKTLNWREYDEVQALFEGGAQIDPSTQGTIKVDLTKTPESEPTMDDAAPVLAVEFCPQTFVFKGEKLGCSLPAGHDGAPQSCNFERELGKANGTPVKTEPKAVVPISPTPIATPATPPISSRAAQMKERFMTGQKKQ